MSFKFSLLICSFILFYSIVNGQNINPSYNEIYYQGEISKIYLKLSESDKRAILHPENPFEDIYYPTDFHFQNSLIDTIFGPVGIRIRGNTSRGSDKRSFKIDFKEYGGVQFRKLKKMNLKPNNNDPSMLRESLSWLVYRDMNVPAARTAFVELYMNDEFVGVYQNVENIDDEFVDRRYGAEAGNLYKCTWGADLSDPNAVYNNDLYELKTNVELNNRSKLLHFVEVINQPVSENWKKEIEAIFNVDNYIKQMAVEATIGHWDGYAYNTNNYYLYENSTTGKIEYIPYDLDNTWGIDWLGIDWGTENITNWHTYWLKVPLVTQLLKINDFRTEFYHQLNILLNSSFKVEYIEPIATEYRNQIASSVKNDLYYPLGFAYNYNDFFDAFYVAAGKHVVYSIHDYIETRTENTKLQLLETAIDFTVKNTDWTIYPNPTYGNLNIEFDNSESYLLKVIGTDGKIYREIELEESRQIDLSQLKPGTYIVNFSDSGTSDNKILMKL